MDTWSVTLCPVCLGRSSVRRFRGSPVTLAVCGECEYEYILADLDEIVRLIRWNLGSQGEEGHGNRAER